MLAIDTGTSWFNIPYISHNKVPEAKKVYINNDMPVVFFVLIVLTACGKNDPVVQKAAINPIIVV